MEDEIKETTQEMFKQAKIQRQSLQMSTSSGSSSSTTPLETVCFTE